MSTAPPRPLYKQKSWSPDIERDEAWQRRKGSHAVRQRRRRSSSVTDEDLEELKGCIDLGFGFDVDSPDVERKLSDTLPALGLYCTVNRQYSGRLSRASSSSSIAAEETDATIIDQRDDEETVKMRLRQWAQVVACSVRQFSGES